MKAQLSLGAAVLAAAALAVPGVAAVSERKRDYPDTIRWRTVEKFGRDKVQSYAHLHRKWSKRAGRSVVGRQVVKFGMPKKGGGKRVVSRKEWRRTMAVFDRWENPPPPANPPTLQQTGSATPGAYQGGTGQYSIPAYIVACESGGDYGAVNPSSGAYGAYQIMPEHWNGGICSDLGRDPAGQDACAARIWNSSGAGAWSCS